MIAPYREDPFQKIVNVGWSTRALGIVVLLYHFVRQPFPAGPPDINLQSMNWRTGSINLSSPGQFDDIDNSNRLRFRKLDPFIETTEDAVTTLRGACVFDLRAIKLNLPANATRAQFQLAMPALGGTITQTSTIWWVWSVDASCNPTTLEEAQTCPFTTGGPGGGIFLIPIFFGTQEAAEDFAAFFAGGSPAMTVESRVVTEDFPVSSSYNIRLQGYATRKVFPFDDQKNPLWNLSEAVDSDQTIRSGTPGVPVSALTINAFGRFKPLPIDVDLDP